MSETPIRILINAAFLEYGVIGDKPKARQLRASIDQLERDLAAVTGERDDYRALWERDSTALGTAIGQRDTARAVAEDNRARYVTAETDRAELVEALRELVRADDMTGLAMRQWTAALDNVRALLARIEGAK